MTAAAAAAAAYLKVHVLQLLAPPHKERRADVQVELRERIRAFGLRTAQGRDISKE